MNSKVLAVLGLLSLAVCGCDDEQQNSSVLSQRYVHKYGYAVSQEEWEAKRCPGQVITAHTNGVTVTATYEDGILHGPYTESFPHSQTVEHYTLYNQGNVVKEITYDHLGVPVEEKIQLSPTRYSVTTWFSEGSPMQVEEFVGEELLEGQYYTTKNEVESRVEKGSGLRIRRDRLGTLVAKEEIEQGYAVKKETFYPNGAPETIAYFHRGNLHGEKRTYAPTGEPLASEDWVNGKLHGTATYFKNGTRYLEIAYRFGMKNGIERHYIDGEIISQEICWENDQKHGPTTVFTPEQAEQQWFYFGQSVTRHRFDELNRIDSLITNFPQEGEKQR